MNRVPIPEDQPIINLANWAILQLEDGMRFFIGEEEGFDERIRTSTPIMEFYESTMTGVTQSGRVYNLVGDPRPDPLEDFSIKIVAGIIGLNLQSVSVVEVERPSHRFH